jgi:hypothetical protein
MLFSVPVTVCYLLDKCSESSIIVKFNDCQHFILHSTQHFHLGSGTSGTVTGWDSWAGAAALVDATSLPPLAVPYPGPVSRWRPGPPGRPATDGWVRRGRVHRVLRQACSHTWCQCQWVTQRRRRSARWTSTRFSTLRRTGRPGLVVGTSWCRLAFRVGVGLAGAGRGPG